MVHSLFEHRQTLILARPSDVSDYIQSNLGFNVTVLEAAVEAGGSEAAMVTPHNAASSYGYRFWDGLVASLRDQLVPHGWASERPGQLEVVRRSDNALQITGSLGDDGVGIESADPSCRHEKGESTDAAIRNNQLTLTGYSGGDSSWQPILTWWILYRFSGPAEKRVTAELSLPREGVGGRVTDWAVRLFLRSFDLEGGEFEAIELPEPPAPIDFSVRRLGS
jgi:hypothetical protein